MCSTLAGAVAEVLAAAASTGEEIIALIELIDQAQAASVERVAPFDAEQGWEADGACSFAGWLRARATSAAATPPASTGSPARLRSGPEQRSFPQKPLGSSRVRGLY